MAWHLAPSLDTLRRQINAAYPGRSKASDGTVGDTAHSSRASDHNPDPSGMVCAIDITHDPDDGIDIDALSDRLFAARDPRIKYLIANGLITSPNGLAGARWVKYGGSNPHTKHLHISVYGGALGLNASPFAGIGAVQPIPAPTTPKPVPPAAPEPPTFEEEMLMYDMVYCGPVDGVTWIGTMHFDGSIRHVKSAASVGTPDQNCLKKYARAKELWITPQDWNARADTKITIP